MKENDVHAEMIAKQVQSAIAPFASMVNDLRKELVSINKELQAIRAENKEFNDLITGAKFLGMTLKVILSIGAFIGMLWAFFLVIKK